MSASRDFTELRPNEELAIAYTEAAGSRANKGQIRQLADVARVIARARAAESLNSWRRFALAADPPYDEALTSVKSV